MKVFHNTTDSVPGTRMYHVEVPKFSTTRDEFEEVCVYAEVLIFFSIEQNC